MKKIINSIFVIGLLQLSVAQNIFPANGNVGIGTGSVAQTKANLHLYSNEISTVLRIQSGPRYRAGSSRLEFYSDPINSTNEWRQGYIESQDLGVFTGGLAFYTNGSGATAKLGSVHAMSLVNGKVGIGTTNPLSKFHIQGESTNVSLNISSGIQNTTGARIAIGTHQYAYGAINPNDFVLENINNNQGGILFNTVVNSREVNRMYITNLGNIGIGTGNPDEKLSVKGKIHAEEVKIDLAVPADYVFQKHYTGSSILKPDYQIPTLKEVEEFTKKNYHLPEVPSADEIIEKGLHLGKMSNILLQKIEELTLYAIEQDKRIKGLEQSNQDKEARIKVLESEK